MGLDSLFERLVVATERIATAMEGATVKLAVELPDTTAQPEAKPAVEPEKPKRGRPRKEPTEAAPVVEQATTVAAPTTIAPKSFLDEDEPEVAAAPVLTDKERRERIRKGLQKLQTLTTPDHALAVLKNVGKVEMFRDMKPEQYDAMDKALADETAKAVARAA